MFRDQTCDIYNPCSQISSGIWLLVGTLVRSMSNMQWAANFRNQTCVGKQSFLPPKSPFPIGPSSHGDYGSIGSKGIPKPRDGHRHHQRTSSESFLIEEQPSWLDELLNEPETPVKRGAHRRSSSDSFAYLDAASMYSSLDSSGQEGYMQRNLGVMPQWGTQEIHQLKDLPRANYFTEPFARPQIRGWDSGLNMANYPSTIPPPKDKAVHPGPPCVLRESDTSTSSTVAEKHEHEKEESTQDSKGAADKKEGSQPKHSQSETDTKRVKQQFAQRSRVRKLQYIAELERHVQALQAEGMEISAELEFMDQQNLILNLENKALKQRLDSLAQEQLVKRLQQDMLAREIARLRLLLQQQQQPSPSPAPTHSRSNSRDLESQFTNLSLKHKEQSSGRDPVTGPLGK